MTVKELRDFCNEEIKRGNANKIIFVADDEEGNGYHGLPYAFTDDAEFLNAIFEYNLVEYGRSGIKPQDAIILG